MNRGVFTTPICSQRDWYTRNAIVHNGVLDADTHLVSKPIPLSQLAAELESALAGASPS